MRCRLLPHSTADGPANMALDQALLDAVDAEPEQAVFRTYGWTEPTLSLGYFQLVAAVEAEARWRDVPLVRRPSGGGALWHEHEITYALILPRSHPKAGRASDVYRAAHAAIAATLRSRNIPAERRGPAEPFNPDDRPFLCFADRDQEDILIDGRKVVGSAQRRRPRALLQHGALLLARADATPELPGLRELSGFPFDASSGPGLLAEAILPAFGLDEFLSEVTPAERAESLRLATAFYRNPEWTRRR